MCVMWNQILQLTLEVSQITYVPQLLVISAIWYLSASDRTKQYYYIPGSFHQMKYDAVCPSHIQGGFLNIGLYFGFISVTTFSSIYILIACIWT